MAALCARGTGEQGTRFWLWLWLSGTLSYTRPRSAGARWSHQSTSLVASASCVPRARRARVDIIHALSRASRCGGAHRRPTDLPARRPAGRLSIPPCTLRRLRARRASRCCIIRSHRWLWGRGVCGGLGAQAHRPRCSHPGSCSGVAAPAVDRPLSFATRCTLTGPIRTPCSVVPPPRSSSSTYRIRTPFFLRGPLALLLGVSSYHAPPLLVYVGTTRSPHPPVG